MFSKVFLVLVVFLVDVSYEQDGEEEEGRFNGILIVGGNNDSALVDPFMQILNPVESIVTPVSKPYDIPKVFHAAAATKNEGTNSVVYITGGDDKEMKPQSGVTKFEHKHPDNTVTRVANMNLARGSHSAVYSKGFVYVCGGLSVGFAELNQCERYDVQANTWKQIGQMKTQRWGHCAVALNNEIIQCGGRNGWPGVNVQNSCESYNSATNTWSTIKSMPVPLYYMSCVSLEHNYIYLCGGTGEDTITASSRCFLYDRKSDNWVDSSPLKMARFGHRMVVMDKSVYVVGGKSENFTNTVEKHDFAKGVINSIKLLDTKFLGPRSSFSIAHVQSSI